MLSERFWKAPSIQLIGMCFLYRSLVIDRGCLCEKDPNTNSGVTQCTSNWRPLPEVSEVASKLKETHFNPENEPNCWISEEGLSNWGGTFWNEPEETRASVLVLMSSQSEDERHPNHITFSAFKSVPHLGRRPGRISVASWRGPAAGADGRSPAWSGKSPPRTRLWFSQTLGRCPRQPRRVAGWSAAEASRF